ncbi:MAG: flagellar protein FlgN [Nitrospira sp.]|nr:flagellar protein FlgN [Nitrospira sp.]
MNVSSHIPTLADLSRLLGQEEDACRALLKILEDERQAVRSLAIEKLHSINGERLALLESLQRLAREADESLRGLAAERGFPQPTSWQVVLDRLMPEEAGGLRARHRSLIEAAESVREGLRRNGTLVDAIRTVIDQALSAGSAVAQERQGYGSDGRRTSMSANGFLYQRG